MNSHDQEKFLIEVMNTGYEKAAASFSQLVGKQVKITSSQSLVIRNESDCSFISEEKGELYILVTQLIGDLSGKSFLIINEEERDEIFSGLALGSKSNLKEAFLAEIDNIISASVISEISNALKIEVYGDVPHLIKLPASTLQKYISDDMREAAPTSIIFSNTTFNFGSHDRVHPQFVWKFSKRIFEMMPSLRIAQ